MKKLYTSLYALVLLFSISIPLDLEAQCTCSGGAAATPLAYEDTVLPTQASNIFFTFPQFDPAAGTLTCVDFYDTVNVAATTAARNTDTTKAPTYEFQTTISAAVSGPSSSGPYNWIPTLATANRIYGPVVLDTDKIDLHPPQPRLPGDSVTFGPDTLINNVIDSATTASVAPYLGTGTVSFQMGLTGFSGALVGGVNYVTSIKANSWGTFKLVYYWCPTILLAENIINFTAVRKNNYVQLQWVTENEQSGFSYEIEYSADGKSYSPAGYEQSPEDVADPNQSYQYQYALNSNNPAVIYFRVKRIAPDGTATYTVIKSVNINGDGPAGGGMQVYPNPARNSIVFAFDDIQNGNFAIQLLNTAGQLIQENTMTISGSNQLRLVLESQPARGLYFLVAKDLTHNQQYISKILVNY
ncbi:MAG TPA: choice-of-anchor E domain-containing protein [Puia sp.]|nr:choice-of-anchor E domain-containing protein [Puia sp.]